MLGNGTEYETFEKNLLSMLEKKSDKCIKFIEKNKELIENNLGNDANPKTLVKLVNQIGDIILKTETGFLKFKNNYKLFETVLKHPYFHKVEETFYNSDILIKACKTKNKNAMKWLSGRIDPKVQDENGMTFLMYAAQNNYQSIVKSYFNDMKCLNIEDKDGNNILFHSVLCPDFIHKDSSSNNNYPMELINSGIDINHINKNGDNILLHCIKNGKYNVIQYLLKNPNIDVNVIDRNGNTAAMYLTEKGRLNDLLSLHRRDCQYDYVNFQSNQSVLSILLDNFYAKRDTYLLQKYARILSILVSFQIDFNIPVDLDENTAFMVMLGVGDLASAEFLAKHVRQLDLSVKNSFGENATSLCIKLGYPKLLPLLQKNVTFNYYYRDPTDQNTLLMLSAINSASNAELLLKHDPSVINNVNLKNENALILASKINHIEAVKVLLKYDVNMDQQDHKGNTALHYAVKIQKPKLVQLLMSKSPNLALRNNDGKTVKDLAQEIGGVEVMNILSNPYCMKFSARDSKNDSGKNFNLSEYKNEVEKYITPTFNNHFPYYHYDTKDADIKNGIYKKFSSPVSGKEYLILANGLNYAAVIANSRIL